MTNDKFNKIISNRIKQLRLQKGLTLEKLAYQSGISKGGLSEIERGMKEPRLYTILKICNCLEMELKDFFDYCEIYQFVDNE